MLRYYTIAFGVGAAVMASEMSAGRLLAPFFGTSTPVWALVIGTVLGSMAAGNYLGGRYYARLVARLHWMLWAGAAALISLLAASHAVLVASSRLIHQVDAGTLAGASVAVTVLLALPMVLLGMFHPVLVNLAAKGNDDRAWSAAGSRAVGKMTAWSTVGSLLGTWVGGIVMVPWLGPRATLGVWASLLVAMSLLVIRSRRVRALVAAVVLGLVVVSTVFWSSPVKTHPSAIHVAESTYNHIEVVDGRTERLLFLNEGYAMQSVYRKDGRLPLYNVWGWYAAAPAWTSTARPKSILLLGLGGGTSSLILRHWFAHAHIVGVELDPAVIRVGRRFMGMPEDIDAVAADARAWLRHNPNERFDVIIVDAFRFPYIPFHLTTREFMASLAQHLSHGGVVMLNVGRDGRDRTVVEAVGKTFASVFPHVYFSDLPNRSNTILIGIRHPIERSAGIDQMPIRGSDKLLLRRTTRRLAVFVPKSDAPVLTDERAPVEWLTDSVIFRRLWRGT